MGKRYLCDPLPLRLLHNVIHPGGAGIHIVDHAMRAQHLLNHILHIPEQVPCSAPLSYTSAANKCRLWSAEKVLLFMHAEQVDCITCNAVRSLSRAAGRTECEGMHFRTGATL